MSANGEVSDLTLSGLFLAATYHAIITEKSLKISRSETNKQQLRIPLFLVAVSMSLGQDGLKRTACHLCLPSGR